MFLSAPQQNRGAVSGGWASALSAAAQGGRSGAEGPAGPVANPSTGICVRLMMPITPLALPEGFGRCWVFQLLAPGSGGGRVYAGPVGPGEREDRPQRESRGRRPDSWLPTSWGWHHTVDMPRSSAVPVAGPPVIPLDKRQSRGFGAWFCPSLAVTVRSLTYPGPCS